ncbi:DJ-1/PfpI family protein [Streptomyces sp. JNUCC 64]
MTGIGRRNALATAAGAALGAGVVAGAGPATAAAGTATGARAADRPRGKDDPLRVDIVMFDGVEELDVFGPFETFELARALGNPVRVRLVTAGSPARVTLSFGTRVDVTQGWDPDGTDVIVVPGGGFQDRNRPGIWPEIRSGVIAQRLRAAVRRGGPALYGICTGVVLLHAAGLVGTRPCTTHTGAQPYLREQGCDVHTARVVDDGDLVTAGGITSGIDGALHLLAREVGSKATARVESVLEFEARGTVLRTG